MKHQLQFGGRQLGLHCLIVLMLVFMVSGLLNVYKTAKAGTGLFYQAAKAPNDPTVYLLAPTLYKLGVPSMAALNSYGISSDQVEIVPSQYLDLYASPGYVSLSGSANVYLLQNGQKRFLNNQAKQLIGPKGIFLVSAAHFKAIRSGKSVSLAEAQNLAQQQVAAASTDPANNPQCQPNASVGGEDGCILYQAVKDKNPQECWGAKDPKWQMNCWLSFEPPANDPLAYCRNVASSFVDDCTVSVATREKSYLLCQKINDAAKQKQCQAYVGVANKDPSNCALLPTNDSDQSQPSKNSCLYAYAMLSKQPAVCQQIGADSPYYDPCIKFSTQTISQTPGS